MDYASYSEAPKQFHFWSGVATIAGALRRKVWTDMGYFQWHPNFFIFFVAPPGIVAKSTTADIGMSLLKELPFIHIGPAATSWQAFVKKLSEVQEEFLLPDGNWMPMSAITVVASELGTFLDPRNREMIDVLVSLWDGKEGAWTKITKQDGEEIVVNPWINIIGCTTPSWIAENITDYFSGGGFASRSIFVYAEHKEKLVAYPFLAMPDDSDHKRQKLIDDLEQISSLVGPFNLSKEAIEWGIAWYKEHSESNHQHLQSEKFSGYLSRKQTHIHKLAMVLAAAKRDELIITKYDLKEAYEEVTRLEYDMPKIYGMSNRERAASLSMEILGIIKSNGSIPKNRLFREHYMKTISWETYDEAVNSLLKANQVSMVNVKGVIKLKHEGVEHESN